MEMERDLSRNIFPLGWIEWFEFEPVKLAHAFNLLLFSRCFFLLFLVVVSFWIEMNWRVPAIWINRKSNGRLNASKITITIMKVSPSFVNGGACSADTVDTTAAAAPFFFFIYIKFFFKISYQKYCNYFLLIFLFFILLNGEWNNGQNGSPKQTWHLHNSRSTRECFRPPQSDIFWRERPERHWAHTHPPSNKKKSNQRNNNKFQKVLFFLFVSFINKKNKEKKKKMFVCAGRCLWDWLISGHEVALMGGRAPLKLFQ